MSKALVFAVLLGCSICFPMIANAEPLTVSVDDDGPDNGVDQFDTIQEGIDAVADGGTVNVEPGTYYESVYITKSLTLQSTSGALATILDGNSATENYYMVDIEADDVTMDGFTITNPIYNSTDDASGVVTGMEGRFSNIRVTNCIIHDIGAPDRAPVSFGSFGFNIGPVDGLEIDHNTIYNICHADGFGWAIGIFTWGNDEWDTAANLDIHDNTVYNVGGAADFIVGIAIGGASEAATVASNNVHDISGIGLRSSAWVLDAVDFTGNTVSNITLSGVEINGPFGDTVTGNSITGCGTGVYVGFDAIVPPTVSGCSIVGSVIAGLQNDSTETVDATNNWWGSADGPSDPLGTVEMPDATASVALMKNTIAERTGSLGNAVSENVDYCPWLLGEPPLGTNVVWLNVQPDSIYVRPGETVTINLDVRNLDQEVSAAQAIIGYESTKLDDLSVTVGDEDWTELLYHSWRDDLLPMPGELNMAAGVTLELEGGTTADATIAHITFTALSEGVTQVVFRPDVDDIQCTWLADTDGHEILPTKVNSQTIVIDGTKPVPTIAAEPASWFNQTVQPSLTLTFSASDNLSGIAGYELSIDGGTWFPATSPYVHDVSGFADGTHTAAVRATDNAGNQEEATTNFYLDKTAPTGLTVSASSDWTAATTIGVTFGADCSFSGAAKWELQVDATGWVEVTGGATGGTHVLNIAGLSDGPHTVGLQVTDNAGNVAVAPSPATINVDHTVPTDLVVSASSDWTNAATLDVTFSADCSVSGAAKWELQVDATGWVEVTGGATGGTHVLNIAGLSDGPHTVGLQVTDNAGNVAVAPSPATINVDHTLPSIAITSGKQSGLELLIELGSTLNAVQDAVNIAVAASDATAGLAANPSVTVTPAGGSAQAASFVDESPAGTFNYTWTVQATTPNGVATINASVADAAGNPASAAAKTFNVNRNQITGLVQLEGLRPGSQPSGQLVRTVTFKATNDAGVVLKTWDVALTFTSDTAAYTLTDVPAGTVAVSAKTNWNMRRKLEAGLEVDGQAAADFTSDNLLGNFMLLGGDINNSNSINILDFSLLKLNWFTANAVADVDGDGRVQLGDYTLMLGNWFQRGSPE